MTQINGTKAFNCQKCIGHIIPAKYLKDVALRKAKEWTNELIKSTKYIGVLKNTFEEHLIEMSQLSMEHKKYNLGVCSKVFKSEINW